MKFTGQEIRDLTFSGLLLSLAFAILFSGGYTAFFNPSNFILVFIVAFCTAGIGFLLHELMHKYVAQNYGLRAEYQASYGMLWLALAFSFFGFIFAAPGGVAIRGHLTRERHGKIAFAGPLTNFILAIGFIVLSVSLYVSGSAYVDLALLGLKINALLAAFNMIPVRPFDGYSVKQWDERLYYVFTITATILFIGALFL